MGANSLEGGGPISANVAVVTGANVGENECDAEAGSCEENDGGLASGGRRALRRG